MKLRLRLIPPDKIIQDGYYVTVAKIMAGTHDRNTFLTMSGPALLEHLDDESGQWIAVDFYTTDLESFQADHIREMPSEVSL